jgi:hypothetical protein
MRLRSQGAPTGFAPRQAARFPAPNASSARLASGVPRLVRKTLSFSKRFAMHELWLRLFLTHYNLQFQC